VGGLSQETQHAKSIERNTIMSHEQPCGFMFPPYTHAQKYLQPLCERWTFDPAIIKKGLYTSVASSLEGQSLKKIKFLAFDALTQQALGITVPEILDFRLTYQWLNARIYYYFIKRRRHTQHLVKIKEVCSPKIPHSPVPKKRLMGDEEAKRQIQICIF
jgi:hypothetical protein